MRCKPYLHVTLEISCAIIQNEMKKRFFQSLQDAESDLLNHSHVTDLLCNAGDDQEEEVWQIAEGNG